MFFRGWGLTLQISGEVVMLGPSYSWICPSCGLEHDPGAHDLARCLWASQQELADRKASNADSTFEAEMPETAGPMRGSAA